MDLDRLKQDVGQTWQRLADGWRHIIDKAASALTYFTPSRDDAGASVRWGLLAADVSERSDRVNVALEAPGLDKDDIDIEVDGRRLIVTGRKDYESERKEGDMVISERAFGRFQRVIALPDEVSAEGAKASYRKGVLTVELAKAAPPETRRIKVVSG